MKDINIIRIPLFRFVLMEHKPSMMLSPYPILSFVINDINIKLSPGINERKKFTSSSLFLYNKIRQTIMEIAQTVIVGNTLISFLLISV